MKEDFQKEGRADAAGSENHRNGGVAQLGEHLPCTQGVRSSNLLISTTGGRMRKEADAEALRRPNGLIAQVVRAHA